MKNKTILVILPLLLLTYVILIIFINGNTLNKKYIAFYDGVCWEYNGSWTNLSTSNLKKIDFTNVNVYNSGGLIDNYNLKYDNNWYKKSGGSWSEYPDEFFTFNGYPNFKFINYTIGSLTSFDLDTINNVLSANKLSKINSIDELYYGSKIIIDYDNDDFDENIYFITNMDSNINSNKYFSILFTKDAKNENTLLISTLDKIDSLNQINDNTLYSIIDLDDDKKYELLAKNEFYARMGKTTYYLFSLKNGNYIKTISNK